MKLRLCRRSPLLLLLPALAAAAGLAAEAATDAATPTKIAVARDANAIPAPATALGAQLAGQKPTSFAPVGTKDAPVDGKDGKPHAGPFVDSDRKKADAAGAAEELVSETKKPVPLEGAPADITIVDGQKIPEVNDGVMNDPERQLPKDGTTGTEGGVSQKDKDRKAHEGQTGERLEKKPDSPKEAPPLPHSEQELIKTENDKAEAKKPKSKDGDSDKTFDLGLEKPDELPKKPVDLPHPLPDSAHKDHLDVARPGKSGQASPVDEGSEGLIRPMHSYLLSLTMILVSEIGDKTFLIAALMAMKHDRVLVFTAAFAALIAMTVLSAVLGHAVPHLLPQRFTNFLAAVLFLIFGAKMLREGLAMSPNEGVAAEMQEVEMELEEKEHELRQQGHHRRSSISPYALEMGLGHGSRKSRSKTRMPSPPRSPSSSRESSPSPGSALKKAAAGFSNLVALLLSPAWVQTFVMTFLGEWGDRSQIATIAMAAGQDYWWVTGGAISGHAVCTGVAVLGGRAIAGRVSLRVVTLGGAIAFIIFGVVYLLQAMYSA